MNYDLIIIGGGPVGLFAAFYAGRRNLKTAIIETAQNLGGQPLALYPEKMILDLPGFKQICGQEFSERMIEQAQSEMLTVYTQTQVESYTGDLDNGFQLKCIGEAGPFTLQTRSILVTTGVGEISPRLLEVKGEDLFTQKGLYYFLTNTNLVRGKRVVVAGGGDSALDWVEMIHNIADEVHLVHRRDQFRAQEESIKQLHQSSARIHLNAQITDIMGDTHVTGVRISSATEAYDIPCDIILVAFGFHINLGPIAQWPLEKEKGSIRVLADMETSIPGIFAAGDVAFAPGVGSSKLLVIGMAQATIAVNTAKTRLDPKAKFFPGHSTNWK